ncbi:MAG: DUF86 domain-containing protein [Methanoregulaceae archaeon]|nr:DUF86 domain-containing protein [Methanoregulaceae archaeon]
MAVCDEIMEIGGADGAAYLESRRDALAIERLLEIVGEAFVRLRDSDDLVFSRITDGPAIIAMRNVIAHGYDVVDPRRVVQVIADRVPQLRAEIGQLELGS